MAMSIRNPEVERLARDVSTMTGRNLTETLEQALLEMRSGLQGSASERSATMTRIAAEFSRLNDLEPRISEDELLGYGDFGA